MLLGNFTPRFPEPPNRYAVTWLSIVGVLFARGLFLWALVAVALPVLVVMLDDRD